MPGRGFFSRVAKIFERTYGYEGPTSYNSNYATRESIRGKPANQDAPDRPQEPKYRYDPSTGQMRKF